MNLYVICRDAYRHEEAIRKSCNWAGITNFQIMDPKHDNIKRSFPYVLFLSCSYPGVIASKVWTLNAPTTEMRVEDKKTYLNGLKEIKEYISSNEQMTEIALEDLPPIKSLGDYINSLKGTILEVRLEDRRKLGIYPDGEPFKHIYDVEIHVSQLVNTAKIFEMFNATKVRIKEL